MKNKSAGDLAQEYEARLIANATADLRSELAEATALLEQIERGWYGESPFRDRMRTFLASIAPAQPAAPDPTLDDALERLKGTREEWAAAAGREQVLRIAAESQLAAIKAQCDSVNGKYTHPDLLEMAVCRAFDNIRALLTPAPSPGAGPGEGTEP